MSFRAELRGADGKVYDLFHVEDDQVLQLNTGETLFRFTPTTLEDNKPGVVAIRRVEEGFTEERDVRGDLEEVYYPASGSNVVALTKPDELGNRRIVNGWQFNTGSVVIAGR